MAAAVETEPAPPPGFARHYRQSPLTDAWEPLYSRKADGVVAIGFRAAEKHANSRGFVHGGMIAALADNAMGLSCGQAMRRDGLAASSLVTVSLSVDYLGKAQMGDWLAFDTDFVRTGRTLCFAGAQVTANGEPIARAHATFRVHTSSSS